MRTRGSYIKSESWEALKAINRQMIDFFRKGDSKKKLYEIKRPVTCFVTFRYEEGKARADEYMSIAEDCGLS